MHPSSETPQLSQTEAGFSVKYRGKELYPSPVIPNAEAKAANTPLQTDTLYLLCSPLLGYGVASLAKRLPPGSRLLLLECDPALHALLDWPALLACLPEPDRLVRVAPADHETMVGAIVSAFGRHTRRIQSLGLNAGRLLNQECYLRITRAVELELRRYWRNRSTLLFMGRLWTRNLLSNLADGLPGRPIHEHPRHEQVVVAGAGPSLDEAMPWLKQLRDRFFLVAVDTALPCLRRNGLMPDLVVAVEGQYANVRDFIPGGLHYPAIAIDLTASPLHLRHLRFERVWQFASEYAPGKQWDSLSKAGLPSTRIPALGSVGVVALYLCRFLAAKRIYLTGLDFAWWGGKSHCADSPSRLSQLASAHRLRSQCGELASFQSTAQAVPGKSARPIRSDGVLAGYRDSLNEVIALLEGLGLEIIDTRCDGLALAAPPGDALSLLDAPRRSEQVPAPAAPSPVPGRLWLDKLAADIQAAREAIDDYRAGGIGAELVLRCLNELDFLFSDLPDAVWPSLEDQALARAALMLEYYERFILRRS